MKKSTFALSILIVVLAACSKSEPPKPEEYITSRMVALDLATPDKALKSYWAVRDSVRSKHVAIFEKYIEQHKSAEAQMSAVSDGALAKTFLVDLTPIETFSRDLIDVKVESESRAVIVALIKNSTPIPAGAEVSKFDEELRRDGERYRYILERNQSGWRVSEIWHWQNYKNEWEKYSPSDGRPNVPSLTHEGI